MNKHLLHTILYSLEEKYYPIGHIVLQEQDETDKLFIVSHGALEIYSEFEGNEFLIETLNEGSVLNYRVLFTDEQMYVNVRCKCGTHLLELSLDKLKEIRAGDKNFDKKLMLFENQLLRKSFKIPLDYMMSSVGKPPKFRK